MPEDAQITLLYDMQGRPFPADEVDFEKQVQLSDGPGRARLLTHEQVRLLRDVWVVGAIEDGYTSSIDLAQAILQDHADNKKSNMNVLELFTCPPLGEGDERLERDLREDDRWSEEDDERVHKIAQALAGSLIRLVREQRITYDESAPNPV